MHSGLISSSYRLIPISRRPYAVTNKRGYFLQGCGAWQCCELLAKLISPKLFAVIRRGVGRRVRPGDGMSMRQVAQHLSLPFVSTAELHAEHVLADLHSLDLVGDSRRRTLHGYRNR